jgi:hypothetical protein
MKRVLISLIVGLLIIPLLLVSLLTVKIVSANEIPTAFVWIFLWPLPLLRLLCRITYLKVTAGNVFLSGLLGDYLILSFLTYLCLTVRGRFLKRKVRGSPLPPLPAPFTD